MVTSLTRSDTGTYTEARANYAMGRIYEVTLNLWLANIITKDRADKIRSDILYLLNKQALTFFELQFNNALNQKIGGIHFKVHSNGGISGDDETGGNDFYTLPNGTTVNLLVQLDYSSPNIDAVNNQLSLWGWGTGSALTGAQSLQNTYSKEGYGLKQYKIGQW